MTDLIGTVADAIMDVDYPDEETAIAYAQAAIAAIEAAGFVIVPKEPTEAMMRAGFAVNTWKNPYPCGDSCVGGISLQPLPVWRAMLAAKDAS